MTENKLLFVEVGSGRFHQATVELAFVLAKGAGVQPFYSIARDTGIENYFDYQFFIGAESLERAVAMSSLFWKAVADMLNELKNRGYTKQ